MSAKQNLDTLNVRLLNFTDETIYHKGRPIYLIYSDASGGCAEGSLGINICPGDTLTDGSGTTHDHSLYTQTMTGDLNVNSRIQLAVDPANLSGGSGMPPGHDGVVGGGDAQPGQIIFTRDVSGNYTFFGYEQTDGGTWGWHAFSTSTSKLSNIWTSEGNGTIYFNGSPDPTNVGIGNNNPLNTLDVNGSVAIGNTYAGTITAPTDGVIIKGNVGIGTHNPTVKLDVSGSGHFTDNLIVTGNTILNTLSAGDSTLTNVGITNNASIGGLLDVIGATELGGTLDVTGNTTLSTLWVNETLNVIGATELGGTLDVTGNTTLELVTIKGSLDITGTVNLNNTTQSTSSTIGALTIDGGVGIAKNTNIGGILGVMGATELGGTLDVSGATTISDNLTVTGNTILNTLWVNNDSTLNSVNIINNASVGGTLDVSGATTISDNLDVTGTSTLASATVGGTLDVSGATTISDALNVTGTSTLASATVGGTLNVSGATTISDNLNVTGTSTLASATVGGTLNVSGATTISDNLTVTGNTTLSKVSAGDSTLNSVDITKNASIGGKLDVTGNTTLELVTIKRSLDITGTVNLNNTTQSTSSTIGALTIDGGVGIAKNTNIGGILGVTGATSLSTTLNVSGVTTLASATVGGTLDVCGNITTIGPLDVSGNITTTGTLDVCGNITTTGALDVCGNITIGTGNGIKMNLFDASGETSTLGPAGGGGTCAAHGYCGKIKLNGSIESGASVGFDWSNDKLQDDSLVLLQLSSVKTSLGDPFDSTIVSKYQKDTSPGTARTVVLINLDASDVDFNTGEYFVNYFIVNPTT